MVQQFLERCLLLDLETSYGARRLEQRILKIGAVRRGRCFEWEGDSPSPAVLAELDRFGAGADFVLGHNLLGHDLPILGRWSGKIDGGARLALLDLPVIDTLVLSPLAFPEIPYHRLVKDYKLVRDSASDPVADARLAARLFADEWRTFAALAAHEPERLAFHAFCFGGGEGGCGGGEPDRGGGGGEAGREGGGGAEMDREGGGEPYAGDHGGLGALFSAICGREPMTAAQARVYLAASLRERVCLRALAAATGSDFLAQSEQVERSVQSAQAEQVARGFADREAWAFAVAWLHVSGGGSVLPRWVRERHPRTAALLDCLRCRPCGVAACSYCRAAFDLEALLGRFFGLSAFRPTPAAADGGSLQRQLAQRGLDGGSVLAVLPTGGGKSLCYQLPALVRHHRRGLLTIVVSPLQALMQDQVEQLNRRAGFDRAAALNGLLTPPERGAALERIRLGEVAILYVSPEQLRNRSFLETVEQREIGAWVFDEAHCLSKWGHDFRPDYLYASRFIRELAERQGRPRPPIACFTATAKPDVQREIVEHFRRELGTELTVFGGSARRPELSFAVEAVAPAEKLDRIRALLAEHLAAEPAAAALVYFATRGGADRGARHLAANGVRAEAFHAGLRPPEKRRILEQFVRGELPVVCATNAFGMGIDKEDVRLVVHADIPGSLESYLQEAGRAGRDRRRASCVLLFAEPDVERQFRLAADSRVSRRDIVQILGGLRRLARRPRGGHRQVVVTSRELLASEEVETQFDAADRGADTKVKTAVSWLERAGLVERNQNQTRVFQGRPRVGSLEAAGRRIDEIRPRVPPARRARWLAILAALFDCDPDQGVTADQLAELPAFGAAASGLGSGERAGAGAAAGGNRGDGRGEPAGEGRPAGPAEEGRPGEPGEEGQPGEPGEEGRPGEQAGERVLRELYEMARHGLIERGMQLTAYVQPRRGGRGSAPARLAALGRLEIAMLERLQEAAPEAGDGDWHELSLRRLNQSLMDRGLASHPETLRQLLQGLARDDKAAPGRPGGLELAYRSRHHYGVRVRNGWAELGALAARRRETAGLVLSALLARAPADAAGMEAAEGSGAETGPDAASGPQAGSRPGSVLVSFGLEDLCDALRRDLVLGQQIHDPLPAVERALLFLHERQVIQLQQGLAVFRQAMTIRIPARAKGRRYGDGDFAPLAAHYAERTAQIHVMARYAELALGGSGGGAEGELSGGERTKLLRSEGEEASPRRQAVTTEGASGAERALAFVDDYFALDRESFVRRHFPGAEAATLARATGRASFRAVVESLGNPSQIELVTAPAAANLLILAGPGAGKTRVVVHRCAYLLRVERVPARGVLVVCFNRGAAREVSRRLRGLIGEDARGVIVQTYHGLALQLTGRSLLEAARRGEEPDFDLLIEEANRLLRDRAGKDRHGEPSGERTRGDGQGAGILEGSRDDDQRAAAGLGEPLRDRLLAGFSHILVDEYQDVNDAQYELLSNLAGRRQLDPDRKLAILAVGDDDQTIYGFNGAKVEFIRRFHEDYGAEVHYLVENFRSSAAIVAGANQLIGHNRDRLKSGHPIRVDAARAGEPAGGRWAAIDAAGGGRVRLLRVAGGGEQAAAVAATLRELRRLDPSLAWDRCAVLARTRRELEPIRALCEHHRIPLRWYDDREQLPPLHRVREIGGFLAELAECRGAACRGTQLLERCLLEGGEPGGHPWWSLLRELIEEWCDVHGDAEAPAGRVLEFLYEALAERRRDLARGEGVHLGTVHAAKGLEFTHVLLADGGWGWRGGSEKGEDAALAEEEAERRLFYVGMTRARETLTLVWRREERNPFVRELREAGRQLDLYEPELDLEPPPAAVLARRFALLGMGDLFLDYAGRRLAEDPVHQHLARLRPGDALAVRRNGGGDVELLDGTGLAVAALSHACRKLRAEAIAGAEEVRVVAVVERRKSDARPEYQPPLRCERWHLPLAEIRYRQPAAAAAAAVEPVR
jgi:ATP-dependent DNA helicase RecQ